MVNAKENLKARMTIKIKLLESKNGYRNKEFPDAAQDRRIQDTSGGRRAGTFFEVGLRERGIEIDPLLEAYYRSHTWGAGARVHNKKLHIGNQKGDTRKSRDVYAV